MKTIENVTIFKCDFCKKELKRKHAMENHELKCNSNPINQKACHFCEHLEKTQKEVSFQICVGFGEYDYIQKEVSVFRCKKLDKLMYPFSIEKSSALERYPETFKEQEPMPRKCELFNSSEVF